MKVPTDIFADFYASLTPTNYVNASPNSDSSAYSNPEPVSSQLNDSSTTYTNLDTQETSYPTVCDLLKFDYNSFTAPIDAFEASLQYSPYVYPAQNKHFVPESRGIGEFDANNRSKASMTWSNSVNKMWTLSGQGLPFYPTGNHQTASILENQLTNGYQKVCHSCGTNVSSLWSRDANGYLVCDSCCCFRKINNEIRRPCVKRLSISKRADRKCSNCHTEKTSLWRRNNAGEHVCNSCGLYFKMHGYKRPLSMKKETIQTRKRKQKNMNENKCEEIPMTDPANQYNSFDATALISEFYDNLLPPYSSLMTKPPPPYCPPYDQTTQMGSCVSIDNRCNDVGLTLL